MNRLGRSATLAVASALLVVQGAGLLHVVLAEHELCAEHRELVERHAPRALTGAPRPPTDEVTLVSAPGAATHDHEHCLATLVRRTVVVASGPALAPAGLLAATGLRVVHLAPRTGVGRYRLAPKNSPPG
jgi:hypothetical protein